MFNCNAAIPAKAAGKTMSLNRHEQMIFDYWEKQPDERRHWQSKVVAAARGSADSGEVARGLERELWAYFCERAEHVAVFREQYRAGTRRLSLLNLAEYLLRVWGPPRKPKTPPASNSRLFY